MAIYQICSNGYEDNGVKATFEGPDDLETEFDQAVENYGAAIEKFQKDKKLIEKLAEEEYGAANPAPGNPHQRPIKGGFEHTLNTPKLRGAPIWEKAIAEQKTYQKGVEIFKKESHTFSETVWRAYKAKLNAFVGKKVDETVGQEPKFEAYLPAGFKKIQVHTAASEHFSLWDDD